MSQSRSLVPLAQDATAQTRPFYFLATFWGKQFRDWFCLFAVQSLLSPNNIPALKRRTYARFLICTTREDWDALQKETVFIRLTEAIDVVFIENDALFPGEHKYHQMSRGHAMLANECFKYFAIGININPDSIYPDGSVAEAERLAEAGKDVVMCTAVRFEMEGVRDELTKRGLLHWGQPLTLPKRLAVDLGMRNMHAETEAADWQARNFGRLAPEHERTHLLTCCFWRPPGELGCIIITHNWAPFMINYAALHDHSVDSLDGRAIDGDYIYENFGDQGDNDKIHVVDDSDSIFLLGLTPKAEMVPPDDKCWWKDFPVLGPWSRGYILNQTVFDDAIDPLRRRLYRRKVRWHANDLSPVWDETEKISEHCISSYATHDLHPLRRNKEPRSVGTPTPRGGPPSPVRSLWLRAIGTDIFRPYGAPTRVEFVRGRFLDWFRAGKFYIYTRATARALKGDKAALNRIVSRTRTIFGSSKKVLEVRYLRRLAILSSVCLLLLLALNGAAYFVIEHTEFVENSLHDRGQGQIGLSGIRYEAGWDDEYVRSVLGAGQDFTIVLGDKDSWASDVTVASTLNQMDDIDRPAYFSLASAKYGLKGNVENLFRLLRSGIRPKNVVFLVGWREVLADIEIETAIDEGQVGQGFDTARVKDFFASLSVFRLGRMLIPAGINRISGNKDSLLGMIGANFVAPLNKNFTRAEKNKVRRKILTSYRTQIDLIQNLAKGFEFTPWVFHKPATLLAPNNTHVSAELRQSFAYENMQALNQGIIAERGRNGLTLYRLDTVLSDKDKPYFVDAVTFSPLAKQKIALLISQTIAASQSLGTLHPK